MIKYSEMLKKAINLFPKEIACDDAYLIGSEGLSWQNLMDINDKLIEKTNNFEEDELLGALVWSVMVGIHEGLMENKLQKDIPCIKVSLLDVINLNKTKAHFIDTVNAEDWQKYLKEIKEEIVFD